jgi:uncharacterized protein (TIGR03437 family)
MQRQRVIFAKAAVVMGVVPILLWAYETGPDAAYAGIPGENGGATCATSGCHTGTANSFPGSVAVSLANGNTYTPGQTQHVIVTITDPATTQKAWGFELTARVASSTSTMAGTFAPSDANTQVICWQPPNTLNYQTLPPGTQTCRSGYPLQFIEHTKAGYTGSLGHTGSYSYQFDWTAPSTDVGNITFYVAANAANGDLTVNGDHIHTATLNVTPQSSTAPPTISSGGVISASAFGGFTSAAAGSWIEIYGSNLAAATYTWQGSDFTGNTAPTSLQGVSVSINNKPAVVDYVSPGQIDALIPDGVGTGPATLTVTNSGGTSAPYTLTLNATQPGFLAPASPFNIGGKQYVVAQFSDGTYVLPSSANVGLPSRPAKPGEIIVIYGVGFGPAQTSSGVQIPFGQLAPPTSQLSTSLQIAFAGTQATSIPYWGMAPNYVGLYQFDVVVPPIANSDAVPLTFNLGGATGSQTLYTAVHN